MHAITDEFFISKVFFENLTFVMKIPNSADMNRYQNWKPEPERQKLFKGEATKWRAHEIQEPSATEMMYTRKGERTVTLI